MEWHRMGMEGEFVEGSSTPLMLKGRPFILSKIGGVFHAVDAVCTHRAAYLPLGGIENECVTCPIHGAQFDLKSGKMTRGISPDKVPNGIVPDLPRYEVKVENGHVMVGI